MNNTSISAFMYAENFKKALFTKGLSLKDFSKTIGISTTLLRYYISGKNRITPSNAKKILNALEMQFDDLFYFED